MRNAFIEALLGEADRHPNLWLLTGDLGYGVLEPFAERFADRYLNVGVAEQNMLGVAAGICLSDTLTSANASGVDAFRCDTLTSANASGASQASQNRHSGESRNPGQGASNMMDARLRGQDELLTKQDLNENIVFTYSIGNFGTLRCLEQIRNDVCYHNLNVKIVAVGGGVAYGSHGYTHHAVEELAILRTMPNITVIAPGDPAEAKWAVQKLVEHPGPAYLRLGKAGEPKVHPQAIAATHGLDTPFVLFPDVSRPAVTMFSTGGMLANCVEAAKGLMQAGVTVQVVSVPVLKPVPADALQALLAQSPFVLTVEEHVQEGGLYSALCPLALALAQPPQMISACLQPHVIGKIGSQDYLRSLSGLSTEALVKTVLAFSRPRAGVTGRE
ncbi:MAG: transketolase C-terminal domain-containing protein [Vampirovibrionales bacterium]|nr:transketolase C-terminal domain-containing protein [Vampirovibrionales bacterium]